ncbi:MAG: prolyl oligopeptidase family serine peptidase [Acidobacteriota bacterium]
MPFPRPLLLSLMSLSLVLPAAPATADDGKKPLTFLDLMKFRQIEDPVISTEGGHVAYALEPDRGDGEVVVRSVDGTQERRIERGKGPAVTRDGRFAAALVEPSLEAKEAAADAKDGDKPKTGLTLVDVGTGDSESWERVESFAFSDDGDWLARHHGKAPKGEDDGVESAEAETEKKGKDKDEKKENAGTTLVLRHLDDGREIEIPHVTAYAFDDTSAFLAYAVAETGGAGNGLFVRDLAGAGTAELAVTASEGGRYTALAWAHDRPLLGFVAAIDDDRHEPGDGALWIFDGAAGAGRAAVERAPTEGWRIPSHNGLTWSRDGARLFFGTRPRPADEGGDGDGDDAPFDPYDLEALLDKRELDVWHGDDPRISTNAKEEWDDEKDRTYLAVHHLGNGSTVQLADLEAREVEPGDSPRAVLGRADVPYLKQITWMGWFHDLYWISLDDGSRRFLGEELAESDTARLSPDGRFAVWFEAPHWYLWDADSGQRRNLTAGLGVGFADERHDRPQAPPSYEVAGWLADSSAVWIYDRYDIWSFPTGDGEPSTVTEGRGRKGTTEFRLVDLDPERPHIEPGEALLVEGFRHGPQKDDGLWRLVAGQPGLSPLVEPSSTRLDVLAKAEDSDRLLYTRESYTEFPDLWTADLDLKNQRKLTDVNPQIADFAWGTPERVTWSSADGHPLEGILIRPDGLAEGERCPVFVYYYRFMTHRLHRFNAPVVNHRPSFPVYASHGYCVFLPDIHFEVGRPGHDAVQSLVPGVQKLVDMGVADPERIGLHGHSWSGYQTAYVITQTDIFAAAIAGAPVSNMTSAYGGIRYGSGLARQFQYEQGQSRLGKSLWEARDRYIEASPLFYADRVNTPLLIQFGDEDEAVPWTQGIELYLALRRLDKDVVFLQYRGEPHHLKKYANKLDYSIKMKEYFDHYLLGAPAPAWITDGEPYRGK